MKKIITFISAVLSCAIAFAFVGCSEDNDVGVRGSNNWGDCGAAPPIKVEFASEHSKVKSDSDVGIELFYEATSNYNRVYYPERISVSATVVMKSWDYEDDFGSPRKQLLIKTIDKFSTAGTETVTIPNDWFVADAGVISWVVTARIVFLGTCEGIEEQDGVSLYYLKQGEDMVLFGSFYDFYNYKRK